MKRKAPDEMVQSAIRLPRSLHERLKKAGGDRGMGEEIRRRLEASFDAEIAPMAATPRTDELLDAISFFDGEMFNEFGSWATEAFAFEVLKACVDKLLAYYRPEGEANAPPVTDRKSDLLYGPDRSPEAISRLLVHTWITRTSKRVEEKRK